MNPLFPDTPVFLPPLSEGQFSKRIFIVRGGDTNAIDFVTIASSLLATSGTRIDRGNSLIMPLRLRGGYATTRRRRLYYAHKGSRTAKTSELVLAYQR